MKCLDWEEEHLKRKWRNNSKNYLFNTILIRIPIQRSNTRRLLMLIKKFLMEKLISNLKIMADSKTMILVVEEQHTHIRTMDTRIHILILAEDSLILRAFQIMKECSTKLSIEDTLINNTDKMSSNLFFQWLVIFYSQMGSWHR